MATSFQELELAVVVSREEAMEGAYLKPWSQLTEETKRIWRLRYQRQMFEQELEVSEFANLQKIQEKEKVL